MAAILLIAVAGVVMAQSAPPAPQGSMGMGSWFFAGIAVIALASIISMIRRREMKTQTAMVDFTTVSPELKPAIAPRR